MAHTSELSYGKKDNSLRSYTVFSGVPAVEYASELMPDIETVTTLHTGMLEAEANNQPPFMEERQSAGESAEMLYNQEEKEIRVNFWKRSRARRFAIGPMHRGHLPSGRKAGCTRIRKQIWEHRNLQMKI